MRNEQASRETGNASSNGRRNSLVRCLHFGLLLLLAISDCDGAREHGLTSRKQVLPALDGSTRMQRTLLSSHTCEVKPLEQCEASSRACCACADSACTELSGCELSGSSCPAERPESACCYESSNARALLQNSQAPGQCSSYYLNNGVYTGTTSVFLSRTTALDEAGCISKCQAIQGCNVWRFCPFQALYPSYLCYDEYSLSYPQLTCLLYTEKTTWGALLSVSDAYGSSHLPATRFSSGVCNAVLPPPPPPPPTPTPVPIYVSTPVSTYYSSGPSPPPPPPPSPPPPTSVNYNYGDLSSQSSSFPVGAVVGGVIGGLVVLAIIAAVCVFVAKRRRNSSFLSQPPQPPKPYDHASVNAFMNTEPGATSTAMYGSLPTTFTSSKQIATKSISLSTTASHNQTATGSTASSVSATAPFFALEQEHGIQTVQLPDPWLGGQNIQNGVATIALNPQAEQPQEQFQTSELKDTWKLDPKDLVCRLKDGKPIILGEGGFGRVYRGQLYRADVAVKVVTSHTPKQQQSFLKEIHTLRACHNIHIVQFLGACVREKQTFMAMEFMPRGDLKGRLAQGGRQEFGWYSKGRQVALEILQGLIYLHSRDIAHLDLKSPNILLTAHDQAKIGDVGLGKMVRSPKAGPAEAASYLWAAPEQLVGGDVGKACDMFSLGTVLWEICTAETITGRYLRDIDVPSEGPQAVADMIRRCRSTDPAQRPTAIQVYDELMMV